MAMEKVHIAQKWLCPSTTSELTHGLGLKTVVNRQGGAPGCPEPPALPEAGSLLKEKLSSSLHV